ncbi:HsdR family type I site-specific deoxyribonuclease [Hymenobacter sp. DH14]|uniref:Type I restriction enzyme endonuclease subunit n=1 Tax=Hymenobacter cyanobacteriorum TaxID=2926463 RepID=A0A9X1VGX7_9BACT|nr:HsdR family type I site-specific deoxyribonuclease [Hymenobacter cyanobacteriorum]MCI1188027.1 HsdR family type I site-specific deoxyribonuclease [Hymenobacter cyanobacteriorum]
MAKLYTEAQLEQACVDLLKQEFPIYQHINAFTPHEATLPDGSGRTDKSQVVLPVVLRKMLEKLNSKVPAKVLDKAFEALTARRIAESPLAANREVYEMLRDGYPAQWTDEVTGRPRQQQIQVLDFKHPTKNDFRVVSQLWIQGTVGYRRPDLLIFVNGLPLVFIELKNATEKVKQAYDNNLTNYRVELPQLFHANVVALLSNGLETRAGSFSAGYEYFGEWLRPASESDKPGLPTDPARRDSHLSLDYALRGLLAPERLLDYVRNFVLFHYQNAGKVIAHNHQYLGVNRTVEAFRDRANRDGKLGVFWHTQGSGKSFSMVMLARKLARQFEGAFTFLLITDRDDLDDQLYRNFLHWGDMTPAQAVRPQDSRELRDVLARPAGPRYVFTLIQKFRYEAGRAYPVLSTRDNIIVFVDEAHRSQYKTLAENMRDALPNAQFLAFTGTPLLGAERLTHRWFGEYVSEYPFDQAVADGATVRLLYQNRTPEVGLENPELDDELAEILEDENLTEQQQRRLEDQHASQLEVLRRDDRLEAVAQDLVWHLPRRGFLGKAVAVSIDKPTTVRLYDKVKYHWEQAIRNTRKELTTVPKGSSQHHDLKARLAWMERLEMAVVVSIENGDEEKFEKQDLNIKPHIKRLAQLDAQGHDIEHNFKDAAHPLQLVFVCSMWLVGFDAPSVSTLYLDKPMRAHSLMQAIARANRVYEGKSAGLIVGYCDVLASLRASLVEYTTPRPGTPPQGDNEHTGHQPLQEFDHLYTLLDEALAEIVTWCQTQNIALTEALVENEPSDEASGGLFANLARLQDFANTLLASDTQRQAYALRARLIEGLYQAARPDVLRHRAKYRLVTVVAYLHDLLAQITGAGETDAAQQRIGQLLDRSVLRVGQEATTPLVLTPGRELDLSNLNLEEQRESFRTSAHLNIEVAQLRTFLEEKLQQLLRRNVERAPFAERLARIIEAYNAGGRRTEEIFEELLAYASTLKAEAERHTREGLTEEELELFDLLKKHIDEQKLSKDQLLQVKTAARSLLARLREEKPLVLVQEWHRDTASRAKVDSVIVEVLNKTLPDSYDRPLFAATHTQVFQHFYQRAVRGQAFA